MVIGGINYLLCVSDFKNVTILVTQNKFFLQNFVVLVSECDPLNNDGIVCEPNPDTRAAYYSEIEIDFFEVDNVVDFSSNDPGVLASNNGTE